MKKFFLILGLIAGFSSACFADEKLPVQQTLSIIKPDAVAANHIGGIVMMLEEGGLKVVGMKMIQMSKEQASQFYAAHKERPFFPALVDFMSSGPVVVQVLEGQNAVALNRKIMGATDSKKALPGTIRQSYGTDVEKNAVHGSDSPEAAQKEIAFFFQLNEIFSKE